MKYKIVETKKGWTTWKKKNFFRKWQPVVTWKGLPEVFPFKTFNTAFKNLIKEENIQEKDRINVRIVWK